MAQDDALLEGTAEARPWRVGQIVDTSDASAVRAAILNLSSVWGGIYMPILRVGTREEVIRQAQAFAVDSTYAGSDDDAQSLGRIEGWSWWAGKRHGPFATEEESKSYRLRQLLPASAFTSSNPIVSPTWDPHDPNDLVYAAIWGLQSDTAPNSASIVLSRLGTDTPLADIGVIHGTASGLIVRGGPPIIGGYLLDPGNTLDIVTFWNLRSVGADVTPIPITDDKIALQFLRGVSTEQADWHMWGRLEAASNVVQDEILNMSRANGLKIIRHESALGFHGSSIDSAFRGRFRERFKPGSRSCTIPLPTIPLSMHDRSNLSPGIVGFDITLENDSNQDPRMTSAPPITRTAGRLLQNHLIRSGSGSSIFAHPFDTGISIATQASDTAVAVPFLYTGEALSLLSGPTDLTIRQSDEGRFQTRAAEMLGGMFGGWATQPAVRAVIMRAARRGGVTYSELVQIAENNCGAWPDPLFNSAPDATKQYAIDVVRSVVDGGILAPEMSVHCSFCRVESYLAPRDLDSSIRCPFCGESFKLGLSLSLSKSRWRYRLAAQVSEQKIEALLPVMATHSVLGQLLPVAGPRLGHYAGLEIIRGKRSIGESDLAVIYPEGDSVVVLGEVKTGNRVDDEDTAHLSEIQNVFANAGTRSLVVIATLKPVLTLEETRAVRAYAEAINLVTVDRLGSPVPVLPLVLVGQDLSVPWGDERHPWRWVSANRPGSGLFARAEESCVRNLGLKTVRIESAPASAEFGPKLRRGTVHFEWTDVHTEPADPAT